MHEQIAYCGVDCAPCEDYVNHICPGCRQTQWVPGDVCLPVACCRERGISVCGECADFPCDEMQAFYAESDSHRTAYARMRAIRE